jgi:hypothetical protein
MMARETTSPPVSQPKGFWNHPALILVVLFLSGLPILIVDVPPLIDLPGHMARYTVQVDLASSPALQQFYGFKWSLIGNLGVDLLVMPLAWLFGIEPAVKIIVFAIPVLTCAGLLWVAHEVHGRIPPTAYFALPFAYSFPFLYGFVNFALSMALALLAFGLWLRLGRLERLKLRALLFIPISMLLWLTHAFGWGALGVLAFSAELIRQHDKGRGFVAVVFHAGVQALSLTPPFLLMIIWRSGNVVGRTTGFFLWKKKYEWLTMVLRDRWHTFDTISLLIVIFVILAGILTPRLSLSRHLTATVLFLSVVFALLPWKILGSAYADMRLAPFLFAIAILAVRMKPTASRRMAGILAVAAIGFFVVRLGGNTASFHLYDKLYQRNLAALDHVPYGARLVSFAGKPCRSPWYMERLEHLPAMAVVRRHAFSNDQWVVPGAQLITVHYAQGWPFIRDASQVVVQKRCTAPREPWWPINDALQRVPRGGYDYVWLIEPPDYDPELTRGLQEVWRDGDSVLFRVVDRNQPRS